jgi:uncharacterized protein with PhoU and TrkA domain
MQVADSPTPTVTDIKRQIANAAHELEDLAFRGDRELVAAEPLKQALHRAREVIAHLEAAAKAGVQ